MSIFHLSQKDFKFIAIFFLLIFVIYGQSLFGDFVFDDRNIVENETLLSNSPNMTDVMIHPFWNTEAGLYRPTTLLSYTLNFAFLGNNPIGFHFVNLILYFLVCSFLYIFIKRLSQNDYLSFFASLLFLVLPIHTEVVANISGRSEILALLFSLLLLLEFTKEKPINFWLTGTFMFLAIGSKETAIVIIPILLILLYIKEKNINRAITDKYFKSLSAVFIGTCLYFFLRFFSLGPLNFLGVKTSLIENPLIFIDIPSRIFTSLKIFFMYITKTIWPINLCSDYSFNQIPIIHNFSNLETILGFILLFISILFIFIYIKKKPIISLSLSIFVFSFLPVSNLIFPIGTIAGERLFFFPSLGFSILIVYLIFELFRKINNRKIKIIAISLIILILSIYGFLALKRQGVWVSEEKLFLSASKCAPGSVLSRSNAGAIYLLNGDLKKAKEELELARNIKPIYSKGLNNLGLVYFRNGDNKKAEELYKEAIRQDFPYSGAYENLILLYLNEKEITKARHWLMFLYPNNPKDIDLLIENFNKQL
jgi:hypothetical protein